jgi:TonB family protein
LLVGGLLWYLLKPTGRGILTPPPASTAETARPLGLYVDPLGQTWHVMWNPNATALREARSVQLFVREGDDLNRIDLPAPDLISGSHDYRPAGNDVTFRLEVVDRGGQVSAESFRLIRAPNPDAAASAPAPPAATAPAAPKGRADAIERVRQITQPKATYKAPPVVAAGIRPRINGKIPIDVRVTIDTRGRVLTATPVVKPHSGLDEYLATRAVQAARLWRFEPARENGKAVQGTQTIHFVFEK